jgi:CubicO group peptidase (beta-lactamase class C family)
MPASTASIASAILERHIREDGFSGAGLVVLREGHTVIEHYAGEAAPGLPASPDVLWPIASISKVYTAAMLMRLVEVGALTLNTPVHLLLPEFTGGGREEMRVRHLLTHTAGFIYESPEMEARLRARTPLRELLEEALASGLLFKPGTEFRYADYNYLLAGHIAEVVTGKSFPELVRKLVLEPAGFDETFLPPQPSDEPRMAKIRGGLAEGTDGAM